MSDEQSPPTGGEVAGKGKVGRFDSDDIYQGLAGPTEPSSAYNRTSSFVATASSSDPPLPDTSPLQHKRPKDLQVAGLRERMFHPEGGPALARSILAYYQRHKSFQPANSWCRYIKLAPTKEGGYIQLSWSGANKFAVLQDVLLAAKGEARIELKHEEFQASHLCHQPSCMLPDHVCQEGPRENNRRKGCAVWTQCSRDCEACNGSKVILLCPHEPPCIKWHPGFSNMEQLIAEGKCSEATGNYHLEEQFREEQAKRFYEGTFDEFVASKRMRIG